VPVAPTTHECTRCGLHGVVDYYNMYDYLKLPKWVILKVGHSYDYLECPKCKCPNILFVK